MAGILGDPRALTQASILKASRLPVAEPEAEKPGTQAPLQGAQSPACGSFEAFEPNTFLGNISDQLYIQQLMPNSCANHYSVLRTLSVPNLLNKNLRTSNSPLSIATLETKSWALNVKDKI